MVPPKLPAPPKPLWELYVPITSRGEDGRAQDASLQKVEMYAYLFCKVRHRERMASVTIHNFHDVLAAMDQSTYLNFIKGWGTYAIAEFYEEELFEFMLAEENSKRMFSALTMLLPSIDCE
jgi:hypothetical protein